MLKKRYWIAFLVFLALTPVIGSLGYYKGVRWVPEAQSSYRRPNCGPEEVRKRMFTSTQVRNQAESLQNFFDSCQDHLVAQSPPNWWSLIRLENMNYPAPEHPRVERVRLKLDNGEIIWGLLALQDDRPRPMVIMKCGFLCNSKQAIFFSLMHLFDEGPFNAFFVGNISGPEYVENNKHLVFGGVYEGAQLVRIAKYLRESEWNSLISSLHMVGVSLGGHAALYAGLYDSKLHSSETTKGYFDSVMAICPVVNLETVIKANLTASLQGRIMEYKIWKAFRKVRPSWPEVTQHIHIEGQWPGIQRLGESLTRSALNYLSAETSEPLFFPPLAEHRLQTEEEFWHANNILNWLEDGPVPTLVLGALDDHVVQKQTNFLPLAEKIRTEEMENLGAVLTPSGSHCAFSLHYGWDIIGEMMRSWILSRSPELKRLENLRSISLPLELSPQDIPAEAAFVRPEWTMFPDSRIQLRLHFLTPAQAKKPDCFHTETDSINPGCYETLSLSFTENEVPVFSQPVENLTEAQARTRWLNANMKLPFQALKTRLKDILSEKNVTLEWRSYP